MTGLPGTDDVSVVRSEEVLDLHLRTVESGRVRLRKRVITETVTQTVQVRREELVVERLPVTEELDGEPVRPVTDGHDFVDADYDIVLYAERVLTTTHVVPVERVRLRTHVVSDEVVITEDLYREQVDVISEPARVEPRL